MTSEAVRPRQNVTAARTERVDNWWIEPLLTVLVLSAFGIYATWAAFQGVHYYATPYLSPFYSPCLAIACGEAVTIPLIGEWYVLSPAFLILWAPLGFRITCYYYRKAYYRSFFGSPPGCAVRDVSRGYTGETGFPFVLQNVHRYFFWASLPIVGFLWWEAIVAFRFPEGFGIGLGTVVLLVNVILLSLYTFSCHSCRHICGGYLDSFRNAPLRHRLWRWVSRLNERHMLYAWTSLIAVGLADLYVRLLSMGVISDPRVVLF